MNFLKFLAFAIGWIALPTMSGSSFSDAASDLPSPTEERLRAMTVSEVLSLIPAPRWDAQPKSESALPRKVYGVRGALYFGLGKSPSQPPAPVYVFIMPPDFGKQFGIWADKEFINPAEFLRAVGTEQGRWRMDYHYRNKFNYEARKRLRLLVDRMPSAATKIPVSYSSQFAGSVSFAPPWLIIVASRPASLDSGIVFTVSTYDGSPTFSTAWLTLRVSTNDMF